MNHFTSKSNYEFRSYIQKKVLQHKMLEKHTQMKNMYKYFT